MGKILVIAEKPSVARDIAKVLQAKQEGEGCLIGERYVVSWAVGQMDGRGRRRGRSLWTRCR